MYQMLRFLALSLFAICLAWAGCESQDALVLSLRTTSQVRLRTYVLTVQDRATRKVLYHSGAQRIATGRDLSSKPLAVGIPFSSKGEYLVVVLAADYDSPELLPQPGLPTPTYFFASIVTINQTQNIDALLLPVAPEYDLDGDHFPEAKNWVADLPEAMAQYGDRAYLLDCLDVEPGAGDLLPIRLRAYDIHPLAPSICDAKLRPASDAPANARPPFAAFDTTCGGSPRTCIDADGDGEPENTDCDDNDARRHHGNPRPRNCCQCTNRETCATNHDKIADLTLCQPPRCSTSFDYDCSGQDVDCFVDEDCDGYSPQDPLPSQRDCDDTDPRIHPGAAKICDPPNDADIGKDWACDGNPQGGCVDCDLDGDGYQRSDPASMCPTKRYAARYAGRPIVLDCNDDDRGMFPGSTVYQSPLQLYKDNTTTNKGGTVAGALRGLCRNTDLAGKVQDSNCDGQATLGCPTPACDADGDGFPNATAGCAPTDPRLLDCDDTSPQIFPGAPQYGKDGKDHDCDGKPDTCGTDVDGDGYCALYDCDDKDAAVHPFAADSCNGKDDDCDGIVDELNPDPSGNRMVETRMVNGQPQVMTTSCADSTIGDCGLKNARGGYSGRCVCTSIVPNSTINAANRVQCPGGRDNASISPKCFAAIQPGLQTCDADSPRDEDCDGRTDAPDGKNLASAGAGTVCGATVGRCRAGSILGCDRTKLNPFSAAARPQSAQGPVPGFNERDRFLVCDPQSGVVNPTEELCNGYDDDCDGKLPGADPAFVVPDSKAEIDRDMDTFLRCTGCTQVGNAQTFNKGLFRACGDCDDSLQSGAKFYPAVAEINYAGAAELCDGLSNKCDPNFVASVQDGVEQCGGGAFASTPACCQGPPQCIDPKTNLQNCGGCGKVCSASVASVCAGGQCMCKADPACDPTSQTKRYCQADVGCVQCRQSNADCAGLADTTLKFCDAIGHRCVQCLADADCAAIAGTICDSKQLRTTASDSRRCIACAGNADCKNAMRPQCLINADLSKNVCAQCGVDSDCKAFKKAVCLVNATDPSLNACRGCSNNGECKDPAQPICSGGGNPSTSVCTACLTNTDCKDAMFPLCQVNMTDASKNACVACISNTDCKDAMKPACAVNMTDPTKNVCTVCATNADCKVAATPACLVNAMDATKNTCVQCIADAQCPMGKTCDLMKNMCK